MKKYRITRDLIPEKEISGLSNPLTKGAIMYSYEKYTYGCISPNGIALTFDKNGGEPFIEIPKNAIELIETP